MRWRGRWAGWGAGPAGAGSAGGPSRLFLGIALAAAVVSAALLLRDGKLAQGGIVVSAALYFGLRLLGVIGRDRDE